MAPEARQKDPAPDFGKIAENIGSSQGAGRVPSDSPAIGQGIKARLPNLSGNQAMSSSSPTPRGNLSRRGFIERSTLAMAAAGLPLWFSRQEAHALVQEVSGQGKPDGLTMGAIGIGSPQSRGRAIYNDAR